MFENGDGKSQRKEKRSWEKNIEYDILLAFWLAIDRENTKIADWLIDWDVSLRYFVTQSIMGKSEISKVRSIGKRISLLNEGGEDEEEFAININIKDFYDSISESEVNEI